MPITAGNIIGSAIDVADIGGTFAESRKKGTGFIGSASRAAGQQLMWMYARPMVFASMGVGLLSAGAGALRSHGQGAGKVYAQRQNAQYSHKLGGGNYVDTQANATMRQRGVQAIQQSGQNLNSVFGSEARTYFRGTY